MWATQGIEADRTKGGRIWTKGTERSVVLSVVGPPRSLIQGLFSWRASSRALKACFVPCPVSALPLFVRVSVRVPVGYYRPITSILSASRQLFNPRRPRIPSCSRPAPLFSYPAKWPELETNMYTARSYLVAVAYAYVARASTLYADG